MHHRRCLLQVLPRRPQGQRRSMRGSASDVLLQEATQLLKSLRLPQVKVMRVSQLSHDESSGWVLLDSGATHSLRPAMNDEEWKAAQPTEVSLAKGVTQSLRLKQGTRCLLSNPADEKYKSWILPLGGLTGALKYVYIKTVRWLAKVTEKR